MTATKISALAAGGAITGDEELPVVQSGNTKKITVQDIVDFAGVGGGSGGGLPGQTWGHYQAALLEPDAIEAAQVDAFSYAVGSVTKFLLASWQTRLGSSGRMEQRTPQGAMPLRDVTLVGTAANSVALLLDPAAATYADPWATYYARLEAIAQAKTKNIAITGASQNVPLLPGAYGAIITQVTTFNLAWIILRFAYKYGPNLWNEVSDSTVQRVGNSLLLPLSKRVAGTIESSSASSATGGAAGGSVSFVLLPSTWSSIADPVSASYTFRDDFMGATLDTGVWTRAESVAGNVEIDTSYQWCKLKGAGSWGGNGLFRTATEARAAGKTMVCDFYAPHGMSGTGIGCVGWHDGAGHAQSDFAHCVNFAGGVSPNGIINIYENGTNRGTVGSGWTSGGIYRVKIVLTSGGAEYYIQGGATYPAIGSASWTNITPGTSSSATATLTVGASAYGSANPGYISDMRVYS